MSWREIHAALYSGPPDRMDAWHLVIMAERAHGVGKPFTMSQNEICRLARCHPRVTQRALIRLREAGWIGIVRHPTPARATVWELLPQPTVDLWITSSTGLGTDSNEGQTLTETASKRVDTISILSKERYNQYQSDRSPIGHRSVVPMHSGSASAGAALGRCPECQGTTWQLDDEGNAHKCQACHGKGLTG